MYIILMASTALFFIGTCLLTYDLAKRKKRHEDKWINDNIWKDASEWDAYQAKYNSPQINLSL